MEEYDWGQFVVITSLLPGYDTFVDYVRSYTDTSYFLWELQDVLTLEMSVGANDLRTKRMLQQVASFCTTCSATQTHMFIAFLLP